MQFSLPPKSHCANEKKGNHYLPKLQRDRWGEKGKLIFLTNLADRVQVEQLQQSQKGGS